MLIIQVCHFFFFICICMSIFIRNYKEKLHRFLHRGWPKSGMQKWKHNFPYYNNNFKKVNNTIRNLEEYYILSEQIVFLLPLTLVFFRTTRHGFLHFADSATGCLYINTGYVTLPFFTSRDKICNIVVTDYKTRWFSSLTLKLNFLWWFTSYFFLTFSKNVQSSRSASATKGFSRNCVVSHGNQWRVRDCHFRFTSATFYVFGA